GGLPADECLVTRAPVPFAPMALIPAIGSARGLEALQHRKLPGPGLRRADGGRVYWARLPRPWLSGNGAGWPRRATAARFPRTRVRAAAGRGAGRRRVAGR